MIAGEAVEDRNWWLRSSQVAIRSASVSAPDAFLANASARLVSAGPKAPGRRAYRLSAPTGSPSAISGTAKQDRMPSAAACLANRGHRPCAAVSSMRTG